MKKSKLCKAVAMATALGGLSVGVYAPTTGAVNLSANGLGEVLIFPYYTARDNWQTTLSIINTDETDVVAVKFRFMEGENSRDALDFNVILSPGDVFAGVVETNPTTGATQFRRTGGDTTCTSPTGWTALPLNSAAFTGDSEDGGRTDSDRMREGYVVVMNMGQSTAMSEAVHDSDDFDCQVVDDMFTKANIAQTVQLFGEPDNVLKGNYSFLNVPRGTAAGGSAVTLANMVTFSNTGNSTTFTTSPAPARPCSVPFFSSSSVVDSGRRNTSWNPNADSNSCPNLITAQDAYDFLEPSLDDAYPAVAVVPYNDHSENLGGSNVYAGVGYEAYGPTVGSASTAIYGFEAVSEVLRATTLVNEWSTNPALGVSTDWVVTHPTKGFFVDRNDSDHQAAVNVYRFPGTNNTPRLGPPTVARVPFAQAFDQNDDGLSCNRVAFRIWNREEVNASPGSGGTQPSPAPAQPNLSLCYETNVIPFSGSTTAPARSAVFGSRLLPAELGNVYTALNSVRPYGWMQLELDADPAAQWTGTTTRTGALNGPGLPAIGFMIRERAIPGSVTDSYSDLADHTAVKELGSIVPQP